MTGKRRGGHKKGKDGADSTSNWSGGKRGRFFRRDFKDGRRDSWREDKEVGGEVREGKDGEVKNAANDLLGGGGREGERGGERENDKGSQHSRSPSAGWDRFSFKSEAFETYYKTQGIVPDGEWEGFLEVLRKPLPATFRINGSGQFANEIRDQMKKEFADFFKGDVEEDGVRLSPPRPLPWYPNDLAWHLSYSRMQLRRSPMLKKMFDFLKQENELGGITRQEAVSMLPPFFLDVQPHHRVLDMCAAPGSKTFQLLEMTDGEGIGSGGAREGEKVERNAWDLVRPKGLVVANDADVQRCHLLIHQIQRMGTERCVVTNHEAQLFPSMRKRKGDNERDGKKEDRQNADVGENAREEEEEEYYLYDRILCDVPCSGDGTLRKAPDMWRKWSSGMGNGLHSLQVRIAMRAVSLLRVGGLIVYSTCSLNPIENEAVVQEILRQSDGCMHLLDVSSKLPQLKRMNGMKAWKVKVRDQWYLRFADVPDGFRSHSVLPSMFPLSPPLSLPLSPSEPTKTEDEEVSHMVEGEKVNVGRERDREGEVERAQDAVIEMADEGVSEKGDSTKNARRNYEGVSPFPLEKCMRILPHHGDTGGFFVAVLKKTGEFKGGVLSSLSGRERRRGCDLPEEFRGGEERIGEKERAEEREQRESMRNDQKVENGSAVEVESSKNMKSDDSQKALEAQDIEMSGKCDVDREEKRGEEESKGEGRVAEMEKERGGNSETGSYTQQQHQRVERGRGKPQRQGRFWGVDPVLFVSPDDFDYEDEGRGAKGGTGESAGEAEKETEREGEERGLEGKEEDGGEEGGEGGETKKVRECGIQAAGEFVQSQREAGAPDSLQDLKKLENLQVTKGCDEAQGVKKLENLQVQEAGDEAQGVEKSGNSRRSVLQSIREYYGISPSFPLDSQLVKRSEEGVRVKRLYFVSREASALIKRNLESGQNVKIVSTGVKMFERQSTKDGNVPCSYRIVSQSLPLVLPYITRNLYHASPKDFRSLLVQRSASVAIFEDEKLRSALLAAPMGCLIVKLKYGENENGVLKAADTETGSHTFSLSPASDPSSAAAPGDTVPANSPSPLTGIISDNDSTSTGESVVCLATDGEVGNGAQDVQKEKIGDAKIHGGEPLSAAAESLGFSKQGTVSAGKQRDDIAVCVWKGKFQYVSMLLSKIETEQMLHRLNL